MGLREPGPYSNQEKPAVGSAAKRPYVYVAAAAIVTLGLPLAISGDSNPTSSRTDSPAVASLAGASLSPLALGTHNDTAFTYSGTWKRTTHASYYKSDDRRSPTTGNVYRFDFDGTQAKLYATRAPGMGIMRVSVDSGVATDVDLYASSRRSQTLVYSTPELSAGIHTLTVTVTGTKNRAASGRTVNADRVDVLGPVTATTTPTTTSPPPTTTPTTTTTTPTTTAPTTTSPPPVEPMPGSFHAFGTATVTSDFNVAGAGRNVDTIAFWEAPDAAGSLMFVTSKNAPLVEVWRHPFDSAGQESTPLAHSCLSATADSATNGVVVDQEADLLYVASNFSPNVCVFSLPELAHRLTITSGATYGLEPNLALLSLPDGSRRLYVSNNRVVYVHDAVTGAMLAQFTPLRGLETMWGDTFDQVLYIPDEGGRTGVYAYNPDGTTYTRNGTNVLGNSAIFDADAEGILEYTCPATGAGDTGTGLIVVSDQIDSSAAGNDYEVFDRRTWAYLGKLKLRLPSGSGYVFNTDGIGTTQQASTQYPGGLFTAIHDDTSVAGVGWSKVFDAISAQTGQPFGCG